MRNAVLGLVALVAAAITIVGLRPGPAGSAEAASETVRPVETAPQAVESAEDASEAEPARVRPETSRLTLGLPRPLTVETMASGLDTPWDLAWGPDDMIWVSERGGRISRLDPTSGEITEVGQLDVLEVSESGLMGIAFHPRFEESPWVYAAHSYRASGGIRNRLVRMRFDGEVLGPPEVLLDDIPGQGNHNGSRLAVGPDGALYMSTGDASEGPNAQDLGSLAGKILRLSLEGDPAPDNPFGSAVFSFGHRNPQGLAFHPRTGVLYSAEHGPSTNDEVNRIRPGGNYGWPRVHGFCDGDVRGEEAYCREHEVVEPLEAWTPTVGLSGLAVYDGALIPEWRGSLLVTSLRGGALFQLRLAPDGAAVLERTTIIRGQYGRLRDVLVGPQGEVYLATSNRDGRGRADPEDDRILRIRP